MEQMILASASPRRLELLRQVGIEPVVEPSHVQEVITSTIPGEVVMELSRQKAEDIAGLHRGEQIRWWQLTVKFWGSQRIGRTLSVW